MDSNKRDKIINSQIDVAINRYAYNMPRSMAEAKAKEIVKKSLKKYRNKSDKGLSTLLSSDLRKLTRSSYSRTSSFNMPERLIIIKPKVDDYIEEYKYEHMRFPSDDEISKKFRISKKDVDRLKSKISATGGYSEDKKNDALNIEKSHSQKEAFKGLSREEKKLAKDIFFTNMSNNNIQKKHKIGKTAFFKYKKNILGKIHNNYSNEYIKYE